MFTSIGQNALSPRELIKDCFTSKLVYGRNTVSILELENGVHKFSKCCNPYPGQSNVVAALSERGVAFHRDAKYCSKIKMLTDLDRQKLLIVNWDMDSDWESSLEFDLRIIERSLPSIFTRLSRMPPSLHIHQMEEEKKRDIPFVRISVCFKSFYESRLFFKEFEPLIILIERYGKEKNK